MINYTLPIIILIIDIYIMISLGYTIRMFNKSDLTVSTNRKGKHRAILLFIANTFAMLTAIVGYFILDQVPLDILLIGRFADRYVMLFAYKDLEIA
jgi:hypothetical protein